MSGKRFSANLELERGGLLPLVVKVEALVDTSPDGLEWVVGPVDCIHPLDPDEVEWAKDALAAEAHKEEQERLRAAP